MKRSVLLIEASVLMFGCSATGQAINWTILESLNNISHSSKFQARDTVTSVVDSTSFLPAHAISLPTTSSIVPVALPTIVNYSSQAMPVFYTPDRKSSITKEVEADNSGRQFVDGHTPAKFQTGFAYLRGNANITTYLC